MKTRQETPIWFCSRLLISYLLFNPVRKLLEDRRNKVQSDIDEARKNREEAEALKAQYDEQLKNADKDADKILADARKQAESMVTAAREEAEEMLEEARSQKAELLDQHEIMRAATGVVVKEVQNVLQG